MIDNLLVLKPTSRLTKRPVGERHEGLIDSQSSVLRTWQQIQNEIVNARIAAWYGQLARDRAACRDRFPGMAMVRLMHRIAMYRFDA